MITTGGSIETGHPSLSNVTQWIYSGGKFEYKATYPGLEHVPACGANTNAGKRGANTGALAVYGEPLMVSPCHTGIPDSNLGWEDVRPYLPPEILRKPKMPLSHEQIVAALKKLTDEVDVLAAKKIEQFEPIYQEIYKTDIGGHLQELADAFNSDHGADLFPGVDPGSIKATEDLVKKSIALSCVYYALQGKQPE